MNVCMWIHTKWPILIKKGYVRVVGGLVVTHKSDDMGPKPTGALVKAGLLISSATSFQPPPGGRSKPWGSLKD